VCVKHSFRLPFFSPSFLPYFAPYVFPSISLAVTSSPIFVHPKRTQFGLRSAHSEDKRRAATVFIHMPILSNLKFICRQNSSPDTNS